MLYDSSYSAKMSMSLDGVLVIFQEVGTDKHLNFCKRWGFNIPKVFVLK